MRFSRVSFLGLESSTAAFRLFFGLAIGLAACAKSPSPPAVVPEARESVEPAVFAVDGGPVHTEPIVLNGVAPQFPTLARQEKRTGEVLLRVRVDKDGDVRWILLEESDRYFDGAAVRAVREWEFTPALRDGEPIAVDVLIPMRFRADG